MAVWRTGNMGATAIRSAAAFPGLELDTTTGMVVTADIYAALSDCDAVAHMSFGDICAEKAGLLRGVAGGIAAQREDRGE